MRPHSEGSTDHLAPALAQPADPPIRVLVAHHDNLARAGVRAVLEARRAVPTVEVVAVAATGDEAVALAGALRPDVVVVSSAVDDVQITRRIQAAMAPEEAGVLLVLGIESDTVAFEALRAGARGLLTTAASPEDLAQAVVAVAAGEAVLAPSIARRVIDNLLARPERLGAHPEQLAELTSREREVMALVASGLTNHQIAQDLIISPATAKTHVSRAMVKLHAHDRAQLAVLAYQTGLVFAGGARAAAAAAHRIAGHSGSQPSLEHAA